MDQDKPGYRLTPCNNECELTREGYCRGCLRTIEEIANWAEMSDEEKRKIMAELPNRRAKIIGPDKSQKP